MERAGYKVLREASMREVLEHFLLAEGKKFAAQRDEFARWSTLDDSTFFQCVRKFADGRADVNPTLTWTIGTRGNSHHKRVSRWTLALVNLAAIYACRINSLVKDDLNAVQGNLVRFSTVASKYLEFQKPTAPEGKLATIIVVASGYAEREGTIEVVDGAHRVVAMAVKGILETQAFLAELRSGD